MSQRKLFTETCKMSLALIAFLPGTQAQVSLEKPALVKNINKQPSSDTHVVPLFGANGLLFFKAFTPGTGWELWKSDGTTLGTKLIKDMTPGPASSFNRDGGLYAMLKGTVFFIGSDAGGFSEGSKSQLWKTDGTEEGTLLVKGFDVMQPLNGLTAVGNYVYFRAPHQGWWRSDGTPAGTVPLQSLHRDLTGLLVQRIDGNATTGIAFLTTADTNGFSQLWRTDGTPSGTSLLFTGALSVEPLGTADRNLFFTLLTTNGFQLSATDGTAAGSVPLKQLDRYNFGSSFTWNKHLFFSLRTSVELWKSDGTPAGTAPFKDSPDERNDWLSMNQIAATNRAAFVESWSESPTTGKREFSLWKCDGTDQGTLLLRTFPESQSITDHLVVQDTLFFALNGGGLWRSDGTPAGTFLIKSISPDATLREFVELNDSISFVAWSGVPAGRLWTSDGTASGTVPVLSVAAASPLIRVNGNLFFTVADPAGGVNDLWKTDGSTAGTVRLLHLDPTLFSSGSDPGSWARANGKLYFSAYDGTNYVTWESDGTEAGTIRSQVTSPPVQAGDSAFFAGGFEDSHGVELWRLNPLTAKPELVKDIVPGRQGSFPELLTDVAGTLFFTASSASGLQLWKSDGTSPGTLPVKTLPAYSASNLKNAGSNVFLTVIVANDVSELWRSDGTEAGTVPVKRFDGSEIRDLTAVDGLVFFTAFDPVHGPGLWKSDGTVEGTALLNAIAPARAFSDPGNFIGVKGTLFFSAEGTNDYGLWRTDGTAAGTFAVKSGLSITGAMLVGRSQKAAFGRESDATDKPAVANEGPDLLLSAKVPDFDHPVPVTGCQHFTIWREIAPAHPGVMSTR